LLRKISEAGIFALNTAYEGLSHQIIEVMALGVPVITTSVGGNPELIENDKTGILINVDDEKAFIEGVQKISSEQTFREEIIKASLDKSERFSIQNTVRLTKAVFDSLGDAYSLAFKRRQTAAKLLRYLFSGGIAAVTDLVLLYVFTDVWGMWYIISSILAFLVAFVVSFILQKFFTFQDHAMEGVHGQALIYLAVTGTNLALNTGLIYLFVQYTGLHYIPAQIVTSILIAIESFLVYQAFIFKK
jgi:putative flippase GtrA